MSKSPTSISVEAKIYNCLDLDNPKSFFLFAAAGSGKTRSLVEVLKRFRSESIDRLRRNAQKVAIITYTNAACDEIKRRLEFDPAFHVSTIHSFAWELIKTYTKDIRDWLKNNLPLEISELEEKQQKGRARTKAAFDRISKIESKRKRLESLANIKKFTYNPNGDNIGRDSLNHSEVIKIAADFIQNRSLMQKILVCKFPILLIDESQDTHKGLIDAFFVIQKNHSDHFSLGMFGDTMQRIYTDGKIDLGKNIPKEWAKPAKKTNFRSPKRIIALINKIRSSVDMQIQTASKDNIDGTVRLFIVDTNNEIDKNQIETEVCSRMARTTDDKAWNSAMDVKVLTLEHNMAARRGGFSTFFNPLYKIDKLKRGVRDGTSSNISFFKNQILPLIKAKQSNNNFKESQIVKKNSPLLTSEILQNSQNPIDEIKKAYGASNELFALWNDGNDPRLSEILADIYRSGLFQIPESLIPIANRLSREELVFPDDSDDETDKDNVIDAWEEALKCSFSQFEKYVRYISDQSRFGTHQGIKGLEFPRVIVILDDKAAGSNQISYEKLFGAKELSDTDINNAQEGKETTIDRTRRLFYVTCSRAEESLAIVAYTKEPQKIKSFSLNQGWFEENEIVEL